MRNYEISYSTEITDIIKTISGYDIFNLNLSVKHEADLICLRILI